MLLAAIFAAASYGERRIEIEQKGRRIQRDGVLIEWRIDEARALSPEHGVLFDAIHTPEGFAGYFRSPLPDSCISRHFVLESLSDGVAKSFSFSIDSQSVDGDFYAVGHHEENDRRFMAAEWILAWDSLPAGSNARREVTIYTYNECGDTAEPVILAVQGPAPPSNGKTGMLFIQIIVILGLLIVFFYLKVKAKKIQRQKR